jgi:hypothetical protein
MHDWSCLDSRIQPIFKVNFEKTLQLAVALEALGPSFQTKLLGADVRAAFLKGDPYVSRELYIQCTNPKIGPTIPLPAGCLGRVVKGVFVLADAPREWYLRLSKEAEPQGWHKSSLDAALWLKWSEKDGKLCDVTCSSPMWMTCCAWEMRRQRAVC